MYTLFLSYWIMWVHCVFAPLISSIYKGLSTGSELRWGNWAPNEFQLQTAVHLREGKRSYNSFSCILSFLPRGWQNWANNIFWPIFATTTNFWFVIRMMWFSGCKWGEKFPRQGAITWNRVWPPRAPRTPQAALLLAFLLVPAWLAGACHLSTFIASIARVKLSPDQPQCGPWCSKSWCQLGPNCTLAFLTEWRQPIGN